MITKAKPAKVLFPEVAGRTFLEAIVLRGDCLPAKVSEPADLIRLRELNIGYTQSSVDVGAKLTHASIPEDWKFCLTSADYLIVMDALGIPWLTITETDGVPVLSVQPLYGWRITNIDRKVGVVSYDIYHPHGGMDSCEIFFHPEVRSRTLGEAGKEITRKVQELYSVKGYPANWRELGAATPMPS